MTALPDINAETQRAINALRALGAPDDDLVPILQLAEEVLKPEGDKRITPWLTSIASLPPLAPTPEPTLADLYALNLNTSWLHDTDTAETALLTFRPWRKGPIRLGPTFIDTEWRSDWKWDRISPHIDIRGHNVLDVGGGNSFYGWRMLGAGARTVLVIDPTSLYHVQHIVVLKALDAILKASRHAPVETPTHLPLPLESLLLSAPLFDTVFSMGVLYHRRDPMDHLNELLHHTKPGGQLVLETLIHPGRGVLKISGRYANMRNIWSLPCLQTVANWINDAGFANVNEVDVTPTTTEEQRTTTWMTFFSLSNALDPDDPSKTVEGHPAPLRATLVARRPKR